MSPAVLLLLALQASPASRDLERGEIAFKRAEYARTIELLRPLLYPEPRLESEGEMAMAHRMLGTSYLFEQRKEQAAQEFRKLLQLRPSYRMDALLDPPLVVDFFNGVVRQHEGELLALERRRKQAEAEERRRIEAARNGPVIIEKRYAQNSFGVNFLPFGAGQFQNGQRSKGWAFLASESVFAGVSVAAMTTNFALYGIRPRLRCEPLETPEKGAMQNCSQGYTDRSRSQLLLKIQVVSGGLFFATAAWGIVDAILNFRPEVPVGSLQVPAAKSAPPTALRLGLQFLDGGGAGGGFSFRF